MKLFDAPQANELTSFYMRTTLAFNLLIDVFDACLHITGNSCFGHSAVRKGKIKAGDINDSKVHNNGVIQLKEVPATKMDDVSDPPIKRGRRRAVAAESYDPTAEENDTEPIVFHEKTKEQLNCLQDAAKGIIFFKKCDDEQKNVLFGAMFEKRVKEGDVIIRQGDDGDNFYVIEKGEYDVLIKNGQKENKVATLRDKGFFGELALLYNCPRNATIISTGEGILWGLDQKTFRQIVVKATAKKRQHFEELLKGVSMLDSLTPYELMNLTDALDVETYRTNEIIIKEGDTAEVMYFIMEGEVCVKVFDKQSQTEKEVSRLGRGKYFGELALVLQKPRVASVYACSDNVKLAVLNINAFERLLGPCVDIMKRNIDAYEKERLKIGLSSLTDELQSAANDIQNINISSN